MKFFAALLFSCVLWPVAREFRPFHLVDPPPAAVQAGDLPEPPKLLSHAEISELINSAAQKHDVPAAFIKSIVAAESAFRSDAVSPKGAVGLMQVMPETAAEMGLDASIPEQNIEAGTKYLKGLMSYYGNRRDWLKRTIAAYNAGPGVVDKYKGVPPFRETRQYVTRVLAFFHAFRRGGKPARFSMVKRQ